MSTCSEKGIAPSIRGKNKNIPMATILHYALEKKLTPSEIADLLGCHISNITRRLAPYKDQIEALPAYKRHRADIFALKQQEILESIKLADIKKAPLIHRLSGFGILFDKERLERGQSTGNVSFSALISQAISVSKQGSSHVSPPLEADLEGKSHDKLCQLDNNDVVK